MVFFSRAQNTGVQWASGGGKTPLLFGQLSEQNNVGIDPMKTPPNPESAAAGNSYEFSNTQVTAQASFRDYTEGK
jgi:hypothetical protein